MSESENQRSDLNEIEPEKGFCPNCGKPRMSEGEFCNYCGFRFEQQKTENTHHPKWEERAIVIRKAAFFESKTSRIIIACVLICVMVVIAVTQCGLLTHNRISKFRNVEVGQTIRFGSYEQDNDTSNGKEEIEWIVLAKEENRMLVTSKYALDSKQYNEENEDVSWKTCTLRKWLNQTFINSAFDEKEKKSIALTKLKSDLNPKYDTEDKVFLLDLEEIERYYSSMQARILQPTAYAFSQDTQVSHDDTAIPKECTWWVRVSDGYVHDIGGIYPDGSHQGPIWVISVCAVRPAMWIKL